MTLYFLKFNNYYNRQISKFDDISGYVGYSTYKAYDIAFNPGDGVYTTQIVNVPDNSYIGDYIVVTDDSNAIDSRWFILEATRQRNGQYSISLKRDVIADNYSAVINAPCFIEKATLDDGDPMVVNPEGVSFNQIKTKETPLKDESNSAWVVGYIPRDSFSSLTEVKGTYNGDYAVDIVVPRLEDWEYYDFINSKKSFQITRLSKFYGYANITVASEAFTFGIAYAEPDKSMTVQLNGPSFDLPNVKVPPVSDISLNIDFQDLTNMDKVRAALVSEWAFKGKELSTAVNTFLDSHLYEDIIPLKQLNSKTIKDLSTGTVFKIIVREFAANVYREDEITRANAPQIYDILDQNLVRSYPNVYEITGSANDKTYFLRTLNTSYTIYLQEQAKEISTKISKERYHLQDQPFDMFCLPYSDGVEVIYEKGTETKSFKTISDVSLNIGIKITELLGAGQVYDLQLLPYCPVRYALRENGAIDISGLGVAKNLIKDASGNVVGALLWATTSQFSFNIPYNIEVKNPKIESQTDMYRLCSPNFNGQFEFNAAKNGGVRYFNVDCSYKPWNPYIHINPDFNLLYGRDFNDARGLVCAGDFSLPQLTNAWSTFELNNKNYQNIFDREVKNLDISQSIQRKLEIAGGVTGAVGAGMSGAIGGALVGGPIGAAVGGLLGAGASTAGAIADVKLNDKLRAETMSFKNDMFGYQLGNIKAIPSSLTKNSALTYNNKLFPIVEYYTCTEEERKSLENKIKYDGMNVQRIGTISEFIKPTQTFIKGRIIRIFAGDDYHMATEIADEISKGVFI